MTRVVHKYTLPNVGWNELVVGQRPITRCVHEQHDKLTVWVEATEGAPQSVRRSFFVAGTGQPLPKGVLYVGTAFVGSLVWHVYEDNP